MDNQLISVVEEQACLCHLEFLNPRYQAWAIRKYVLCFKKIKKYGTAWMQVLFFLNAAVSSKKILVKLKYRTGTRYWQIPNIKELGSG